MKKADRTAGLMASLESVFQWKRVNTGIFLAEIMLTVITPKSTGLDLK